MLPDPTAVRTFSSLGGGVLSAVTLAAALALFTVPSLAPVGTVAGVLLGVVTLSLPLWATGLLYSLSVDPPALPPLSVRVLRVSAAVALGLFVLGFLAVVGESPRVVGDGLYLVAIVLLLLLSVAVPLAERQGRER